MAQEMLAVACIHHCQQTTPTDEEPEGARTGDGHTHLCERPSARNGPDSE